MCLLLWILMRPVLLLVMVLCHSHESSGHYSHRVLATSESNQSTQLSDQNPHHHLQLLLNSSWGGSPPSACFTADPKTNVTWNSQATPKRCEPDVCGGAVLTDIRGLDGKASVSNLCAGPLFDSKRTLECLRGKSILFLGDSTLQVGWS